MNELEIFKKLMAKAEANGYTGPKRWEYEVGRITDGTNFYAIVFREDFAKAIWGEEELEIEGVPDYYMFLGRLLHVKDKWKFLEENVNL